MQCYGAGNIPSNRQDVIDIIAEATARQFKIRISCIILYTSAKLIKRLLRGVIILCVTQCSHGGVAAFYETGKVVKNFGVALRNCLD